MATTSTAAIIVLAVITLTRMPKLRPNHSLNRIRNGALLRSGPFTSTL
ncbi:hypothetical protein NSMM_240005 [Nitrosomonas mobilis]|uniref:Uncharacterized protein n=1 Tax=Nitrosomonas mobilis TaxID=51642 RepID=A0A1G5SDK4_9PROT|nr:hypothetical protein NSMM_240005 [Nitrosomonas mobilis]